MIPLILAASALIAFYFLTQDGNGRPPASTYSPVDPWVNRKLAQEKTKRQAKSMANRKLAQEKAERQFIVDNPKSIAAIKETDPVAYAAAMKAGQEYSDSKVQYFNSLSPEEKKNYRGGF